MAMLNSQMVCFFSTLHRKLGNKMADQELERSWIQSASWRCQKNEECRWGAACKTLDGIGWHQKICNHSHRIHVWYIYIYANIWGISMVNVSIYSIHGSYGIGPGNRSHLRRNIHARVSTTPAHPRLQIIYITYWTWSFIVDLPNLYMVIFYSKLF